MTDGPRAPTEAVPPLRIVVVHPHERARSRWHEELSRQLPEAVVASWPSNVAADFAIGWEPGADFFAAQPRLRAFFNAGAGVDHLLQHDHVPATLPIVRLEDAGMAEQMIEYCCHEVIHQYRRWDDYAQQQRERRWQMHASVSRDQFAVGVLGLGVLGRSVATALHRLGYRVLGFSRQAKALDGITSYAGADQFEAFLRASQVLIVLAPLTSATVDLLNRGTLSQLPAGAYLINVSRGALVVDADLLELIDAGHLAGATLDVFRQEPLPVEHRFWSHPKIRLTPHASARTVVAVSAQQVADKIRRLLRDQPVSGTVDRLRGY